MLSIQAWHDHSGNADPGERLRGHHWALVGLIGFSHAWGRYLCFPLLMQLISSQLKPSLFIVDPAGVATLGTIWDSIHPLLYQVHQSLLPVEAVEVHLYGPLVKVQAVCREVWLRDFSHKRTSN